jgi:hypothetical protein
VRRVFKGDDVRERARTGVPHSSPRRPLGSTQFFQLAFLRVTHDRVCLCAIALA